MLLRVLLMMGDRDAESSVGGLAVVRRHRGRGGVCRLLLSE